MMENPVSRPIVPPTADNMSTNLVFLSFVILSKVGVLKYILTNCRLGSYECTKIKKFKKYIFWIYFFFFYQDQSYKVFWNLDGRYIISEIFYITLDNFFPSTHINSFWLRLSNICVKTRARHDTIIRVWYAFNTWFLSFSANWTLKIYLTIKGCVRVSVCVCVMSCHFIIVLI